MCWWILSVHGGESSLGHPQIVEKICGADTGGCDRLRLNSRMHEGGWFEGVFTMKLRVLFLAVIAVVVLAGSVVPANAASHHRHHRHHHHK